MFESVDDMLAAEALQAMDSAVAPACWMRWTPITPPTFCASSRPPSAMPCWLAAAEARGCPACLLSWPEDSAAAHMVPETLTVGANMTVLDAIATVREHAAGLRSDSRTTAYVYVIDATRICWRRRLSALVLADPERLVSELMTEDLIVVSPLTDKELAAQTLMTHNLMAVPSSMGKTACSASSPRTKPSTSPGGSDRRRRASGRVGPLEVRIRVRRHGCCGASAWCGYSCSLSPRPTPAACAGVLRRDGGGDRARLLHPLLIGTGATPAPDRNHAGARDSHRSGQVPRCPAVLVKELSTGALVASPWRWPR
ncbi:putative mg2+ transport transmembrane protein MgtE [Mycobacterium ulcerans str. Harvey]|uniref:Mg2+ transport transmembrane protein MgtE n=1 Tax=Mycobacterium ulcerans str. Harvey TaxID=1299332 RepID=A0ABN0R9Y1_MYCUL|nr:putative mg2+ transport transmembrane protein MgtE [Mycobacterium ulcerans str. Harvey]